MENKKEKDGFIFFLCPFIKKNNKDFSFFSDVKIIEGKAPVFVLVSRKGQIIKTININSLTNFKFPAKVFFLGIKVFSKSKFSLNELDIKATDPITINEISKDFVNDTLLITPGYPSESNKYLFGFVHSRVKEYLKQGMNFDVAYVNSENEYCKYVYEGVEVKKIDYYTARNIMQVKKYKKIIVHFFNSSFSQLLDGVDTSQADIYLFVHGSDVLYRDFNKLTCKYNEKVKKLSKEQLNEYKNRDKILSRYNNMQNVTFIFPSRWAKFESESQNKIKYKNYKIISNYIDTNLFMYRKKDPELRKKIIVIRKYDNINTYSIDLDVKVILELSKKKCFKDLDFDFYGDGSYYYELLNPISNFSNVHLHKQFLSHDEIAKVHSKSGIGLFATRYETQGVSAAEAMSSGLVVVSNAVAAVPEMFKDIPELLAPNEDYKKMANIIEYLYNNPGDFEKFSEKSARIIQKKYSANTTILKDIELFNKNFPKKIYKFNNKKTQKILTIGVASYNVEKYLKNGVLSILDAKTVDKIEILIIDDGSKDNTAKIGKDLEKLANSKNNKIVRLISKENGGHGSAINTAIKNANGKYFKLMDGDDYFDSESLDKLVNILEKSDEDIILNNYVEDLSNEGVMNHIHLYDFMKPGKIYNIEDLCDSNIGFKEWGPLLSTSTFKTSMLKNMNFKISEKCFYVDMELNSIAFVRAKTIKYLPLDIYIYMLGRTDQSVSQQSFKKNYKHHEKVTLRIIKEIYYGENISYQKKKYIKKIILKPLISGQYYIVTEYFNNKGPFIEFDSKLKEYPEFYNDKNFITKKLKKYRFLNGNCFWIIKKIVKIKVFFRRLF
ncbi:MAG: glycosyltransferase [Bacilli bacterium]|nr:glycosyltransferase [Bacilli bacterium]